MIAAHRVARCLLAVVLVALAAEAPSGVEAQEVQITGRLGPTPQEALSETLVAHRDDRRRYGLGLLIPAVASVAAGTAVAIAGRDDQLALFFGLGTVGWGAVNALLSLGLLDLGGSTRQAALAVGHGSPEEARAAWERAVQEEGRAETIFALNLGLDVFYMASGALLVALADQVSNNGEAQALRGYSIAQISQGALLFVFDLVAWMAAGARGQQLWSLGRGLRF